MDTEEERHKRSTESCGCAEVYKEMVAWKFLP